MSLLSVFSPTGLRVSPARLFSAALAAASVSGCAAGDAVDNPSGTSGTSGPGAGTGGDSGSGGATTSTGADTTTSSSTSGATTSTSSGPGGGEGGDTGTSTGSGEGGGGGQGQGGDGGSPPVPFCGDDAIDAGEDCDGATLGGASCTSIGQGFIGGTLACTAACDFDTAGCTAPPLCGDGDIEGTEVCDTANLGGATCMTLGFVGGTLACSRGCLLDTSACTMCGDGVVNGTDVCDGASLGSATCQSLGHDGGALSCAANCQGYVETACTDCGDNVVESPEACDGSNFSGATCASMGFTGGTLLCNGTCSAISTAQCTDCGDGAVEGTEACDGANLDSQTCQTLGYEVGGTLGCAANCLGFNTAACVDSQCNDGIDNDGDGFADLGDVGCTSGVDASETVYAANCGGAGSQILDITRSNTEQNYYYTFDSAAAPSDFVGSCRSSDGREMIFIYRSPIAQPWVVFTTDEDPTDIDTVLYVRRGSCTGAEAACNDDDVGYLNVQFSSTVQIDNVAANELLFVFVDAYTTGVGGPFALAVYPASAND